MKNTKYLKLLGVFALMLALFSCAPYMDENPESDFNMPPDASTMDFSISKGADAYRYKIELLKPGMTGIYSVEFDLGNGSVAKSKSATAYYPMPGEYTIKMTITTNGGSTTISKKHATTETDYSIFSDQKYVFLTGGINNAAGKAWVVAAEEQGHFGVGPAGGNPLEWWSAAPFTKSGTGAYDDQLIFTLSGFKLVYDNKGVSYVKGYMKDDPKLASIYLNARLNKDDYDVDYATPVNGTWSINEKDDGFYLVFNSAKRIFPGLDVGATNNEYKIESIEENKLVLTCHTSYESWTKWNYILRPRDYQKPKVEFTTAVSPTGAVNTYGVKLTVINIPAGQSITKYMVDFGDGTTKETTNISELLSNTYMRKGTYNVKVTTVTSIETKTESFPVVVASNHPDYQEFLLDDIVMYSDFSEVMVAPVDGENCLVAVDNNPLKIYPNKSAKAAFYSKSNQEWANAFMKLPAGYRFDLRKKSIFKLKVYGKAGDVVLLKLENTDRGGNAWQTGTERTYTIKKTNTWEVVEYNFSGVGAGWDWTGDIFTGNVVSDDRFNHDFYNIIRIMLNPGVGQGTHEFYFDDLAGPHVEGIKSATIK